MTVSANAAAAPAAAPAPPQSDFAQTQALIAEITNEARSSGQRIDFDPDAPVGDGDADAERGDADGDAGSAEPTTPKVKKAATDEEQQDEEPEGDAEDPEDPEDASRVEGQIDPVEVRKALRAKGGVDLIALAKALGVAPEALKLTPSQAKAIRIERRKTQQTLERAAKLSGELEQKYGDQVRARKAASEGELQPAIEFVENTFGMSWNELNKMVADLLQGKPIGDLDQKRELRDLRRQEAERAAKAKADQAEAAKQGKVTEAKRWISSSIKGDKLCDPGLNEQLRAAGMPTVVDMVYEELKTNYSRGLTDPKKALERVKGKLEKHAKALQAAGVLPKTKPAPKQAVTASPRRDSAQTGSAGNGRVMTDAELRTAVLKEAGLFRK